MLISDRMSCETSVLEGGRIFEKAYDNDQVDKTKAGGVMEKGRTKER